MLCNHKDKLDILKYVKGKAGIYLWTNKIKGKKYIGSSQLQALQRRISYVYKKLKKKKDNLNSSTTKDRILWLREDKPIYSFSNLKYACNYNVIQRRNYSQVTNTEPKESLIPVVIYPYTYLNKSSILKDTKNKAGVYPWVNGNTYIGSSVNLARRFRVYSDFSYLSVRINKGKSRISSAILKHGYSN